MPNPTRWTAREDNIVRTHSTKDAAALLPWRTASAVKNRRHVVKPTCPPANDAVKWKPHEDEIVRSNSIKGAARLLERSKEAIKQRRHLLGAIVKQQEWTKVEDRRLYRTAGLPLAKVVKLFKNRTVAAISTRRIRLGCNRRCRLNGQTPWTGAEISLLRKMWSSSPTADVVKALPRHPVLSIRNMANEKLGLKKAKTFDMVSIYEQIRARAREDRVTLLALAAQSGCGLHILRPRRKPGADNFDKIAKAVEFFGGRLVIDWQDV
ncbi:hypothetical protein ABID59_001429 [Bradyrhizobium sp. S3.3.6]|uniref:hypothetical protein n=1 Tax=Bradyrhizobium sp. S3.3.6 TaxID=3156429 RepID=UPI003391D87D